MYLSLCCQGTASMMSSAESAHTYRSVTTHHAYSFRPCCVAHLSVNTVISLCRSTGRAWAWNSSWRSRLYRWWVERLWKRETLFINSGTILKNVPIKVNINILWEAWRADFTVVQTQDQSFMLQLRACGDSFPESARCYQTALWSHLVFVCVHVCVHNRLLCNRKAFVFSIN